MDARLQQRTAEPAAATPREGRWSRLSRGKKVAIVVGIVAGVAIAVAALGNDSNDSGSGGGGY